MKNAHAIAQAITQTAIETMKTALQAMSGAVGPTEGNTAPVVTPSSSTRSS